MKNKKQYDLIIYSIIKSENNINNTISDNIIPNKQEFKDYFLSNIKKSSFLACILPSILFLVISFISFSLIFCSSINQKFKAYLQIENLELPILLFGIVLLFLGLILLIQRVIFKIRCIKLDYIYKKGYHNISNKKYIEILELIDR